MGSDSTLLPRLLGLTKTLLRSLAPPNPPGRVEGALLGLAAIGKEGLRKGLWGDIGFKSPRLRTDEVGGVGVKAWGEIWMREPWRQDEREAVLRAGVVRSFLHVLLSTYTYRVTLKLNVFVSLVDVIDPPSHSPTSPNTYNRSQHAPHLDYHLRPHLCSDPGYRPMAFRGTRQHRQQREGRARAIQD